MRSIKDLNGKEFVCSIADLLDTSKPFTGSIQDETIQTVSVKPIITDAAGKEVDPYEIIDQLRSHSEEAPMALDVTFEATHSGKNKNYFNYPSDELEDGAGTWMVPFAKPLIKNHDVHTEPIGRAIDCRFGPSEIAKDRDSLDVTFRVSDEDSMKKILDGRYHTVSIGAEVAHVSCNICGKDILKDNKFKFCGHMKGESYGKDIATWTARGFTFDECSIVNTPADVYAQLKKVRLVRKTNETSDNMPKDNENQSLVTDSVADGASIIDNLLGEENPTQEPIVEPTVQDEAGEGEKEPEKTVSIEDLQQEIESLKQTIADLEQKEQALTDNLTKASEKEETLMDALTVARKQNVQLASMNKELMADRVADFEQYEGKLTKEGREARLQDLKALTAKELMALTDFDIQSITDAQVAQEEDAQVRDLAKPVSNPGLVQDGEDDTKQKSEPAPSKKTLQDLEDSIINAFSRRY